MSSLVVLIFIRRMVAMLVRYEKLLLPFQVKKASTHIRGMKMAQVGRILLTIP